jgi:hypothetical protein
LFTGEYCWWAVAGVTLVRACSAVLAHIFLKEQLNIFGILGCVLCITGSITIVMHVPAEQPIESVAQVWQLAMQPGEHGP